jgi:hypothetical protein
MACAAGLTEGKSALTARNTGALTAKLAEKLAGKLMALTWFKTRLNTKILYK